MKKRFGTLLLSLVFVLSTLLVVGCSNTTNTTQTKAKIKIAVLKGPTGMGIVKLMEDNKDLYDITLYDSPDEIVSKIVTGEVDAAAVPSNLAPILYAKTKKQIELVAVNTLGVLYIVENGTTVKKISDLKGKTIVASGKGGTPEFVLNYILKKNGLDPDKDVTIEWKAQHSDVAAAVAAKQVDIAVLPEPFVTTTKMKDTTLQVPIDLTAEWKKVSGDDSQLIMGVMIFRKAFIDSRGSDVDTFLDKYKASVDYVNKNAAAAGTLIEKNGILPNAKIAEMAIPRSNIVFISAQDAKKSLISFFTVLMQFDPTSIGGSLPDENFYYKGK